jgi:ribosomal protein S18 acetylase RimI-like enzyme
MKQNSLNTALIEFRPIRDTPGDLEFLFQVYASSRADEMALTNWSDKEKNDFLRMQFGFQHKQYLANYTNASFDIILYEREAVGRLYVDRRPNDIRIIDILLLPGSRGKGIGSRIMDDLIAEAGQKNTGLSLHVEIDNPALGWYERLGFEKKELIGVYYYMVRPPSLQTSTPKP